MLMCASFTLPANPHLRDFPLSDYGSSDTIPVESSYNRESPRSSRSPRLIIPTGILRFVHGIMYYNIAVAAFIALHLIVEPQFQRGAPVWFEMFWISLVVIGEAVCLGLMASSRPDVCNFHFGLDVSFPVGGKITPMNSATSICSNWKGMTALLATIIGLCKYPISIIFVPKLTF
jgi:hypothetical protein